MGGTGGRCRGIAVVTIFCAALLGAAGPAARAEVLGEGWLLGVETDKQRFERLQSDLGGFGRAMLDASVRYERLHAAIERGNWELAVAYWDGIKDSLEAGLVRRPRRAENARAKLLDGKWDEIKKAFQSADAARAKAGFMTARAACIECHEAEKRAFLNKQPLFDDLVFR